MKIKNHLFIVLLLLFLSEISISQNSNSVLADGNWFKFAVDTTGVFKIDRAFLQQLGISTNGLNPKKINIYGNGGQQLPVLNSDFRNDDLQKNAIFISGENDNSFDANDFILFYAKGPHDWQIDLQNKINSKHRQNPYDDHGIYFIKIDDVDRIRIEQKASIAGTSPSPITTFDEFYFFEKDERNLFAAGMQWFFQTDFNVENTQTFSIPFTNLAANEQTTIKVRAVSNSFVESFMNVKVNSTDLITDKFRAISPESLTKADDIEIVKPLQVTSDNLSIEISYDNNGNPSANAFLDYLEIIGKKQLNFKNFQFSFRSFEQATSAGVVEYKITNGNAAFQVWDVSDHLNPQSLKNQNTSNSDFIFTDEAGKLKEYVVLSESDFYTPIRLQNSKVANQNLHGLKDINYLIITNAELAKQAQRLADYHQENSNLSTKVVLLDEIYNEFSSGSKDITGIRDFIKYLYDSNDKNLQFVCFFGDASYDYKDRLPQNNNVIPVKLAFDSFNLATSWVTDDFYVMLDDNEGSMSANHTIEVASSRIPVSTVEEATIVVNKILLDYSKESLGDWRNSITILADDIDARGEDVLQQGLENIANDIQKNKPFFNVNKIYADAFVQQNSSGGERYPEVKKAITNAIEKGSLLFDYFGHGGEDGFAAERFLDVPQIKGFKNEKNLPLFVTITCDFSRFDNPNRITAGEIFFKSSTGGAINMITSTREVFIFIGQNFNEQLVPILLEYNNEDYTIAQALVQAKNNFSSTQKFFVYSFGDPAKKLAIPEPNVKITKINDKLVTSQFKDIIKALSKIKIEGIITDGSNNNNILTNFKGTVSASIFDKPTNNTTLDNDGFGITMDFDSQNSQLFRGKSSVENGQFSFEFVVPKDIKLAFGSGKISLYAATDEGIDKGGYYDEIIIGGIDENAPKDDIGPEIALFMNDESFIDGDNTNASPNLVVLLSDASGINTSITAVDHDIVAILDSDTSNPIILNDFYQSELNDFTKGKVTYKLRDLEVGLHTLKLKAWDTYNNSSETTLSFVVVDDATLNLENVLNYPNPFINYTQFWFNHNKPNEPLEVQVQVFTVSGKLIKTINQQVQTTGTLSREIVWNGLDDFGNKIGKGVYVYKLRVKSTLSNLVSEKYEKLVILQ